jgi:hypothetical protein
LLIQVIESQIQIMNQLILGASPKCVTIKLSDHKFRPEKQQQQVTAEMKN